MPIALRCPQCGDIQFINEDMRHETVPCKGCAATLRVPRSTSASAPATSSPPAIEPALSFADKTPAFSDNPFAERAAVMPGKAVETENPYQTPHTVDEFSTASGVARNFRLGRDPRLASRWKRFFGAMIDSLFYFVAIFIGGFIGGALTANAPDEVVIAVAVYGFLLLALIVNAILVTLHGQTIGKMLLGTKIIVVDTDALPGFARGVLMRGVLPGFIGNTHSNLK